jgi:hypothetical protein
LGNPLKEQYLYCQYLAPNITQKKSINIILRDQKKGPK